MIESAEAPNVLICGFKQQLKLPAERRSIENVSFLIYRRSNSNAKLEYHVTRHYTYHYHRCQSESNLLHRELERQCNNARPPPRCERDVLCTM